MYGPYKDQSDALRAERALKHGKRGVSRTQWSPSESAWCRGHGPLDDWVLDPTKRDERWERVIGVEPT